MQSKAEQAVAGGIAGGASRRERRVLRKLLYIEQHHAQLGEETLAMTRLLNFNKEMIDHLKAIGMIELSATLSEGRLEWHVRLSPLGRATAETFGAMRPIEPATTSARRLERAGRLGKRVAAGALDSDGGAMLGKFARNKIV